MELLLVGSTGLVGSHVLSLALRDARVTKVTTLVRHQTNIQHPKLQEEIIDFDHLPREASWWKADSVICTLGTTMKKAQSKKAFKKVDLEYPLAVAQLAKIHQTPNFVVNSAMGANSESFFFYNQVKGELEDRLEAMGFRSLTFVRPGLIGGKRSEFRLVEEVGKKITGALSPLLPRGLRLNEPQAIAKHLLEAALMAPEGKQIITSEQLIE